MEFQIVLFLIVFFIGLVIAYKLGNKIGSFRKDQFWKESLPGHRKDAIMKSRSVLGGNFSEQLAPFLPNFKYLPTECKFLGKPIDLLVFKGMDEKRIDEVVFVEVKSGNSNLSPSEKKLKEAVEDKRVRWEEYRVPEELTKRSEE